MTTPNQPGWYDDPHDSNAQRYWDGQDWTPHRQRKSTLPSARPPVTPTTPQQPLRQPDLPPPPGLAYPATAPTQPVSSPPPSPRGAPPTPPAPPPTLPPPPAHGGAGAGQVAGNRPGPPPQAWPPPSPTGPPPQAWPPPQPQTQGAWAGPSPDAQSLAAPKGIVARLSVQAGLLFGGFVIAAIALFFPWVTVSVDSPLGGDLYKADASPFTGGWIFAVLVVIAGAAWLAWPILSGSQMSVKRLSGLTAVVCLQIGCLVIGFIDYANGAVEKSKATTDTGEQLTGLHVSVGLGLLLYGAAVVVITVGVVRLWIQRSQGQKHQAY
jgi:Protein of unknown function (DUF2510)